MVVALVHLLLTVWKLYLREQGDHEREMVIAKAKEPVGSLLSTQLGVLKSNAHAGHHGPRHSTFTGMYEREALLVALRILFPSSLHV